MVRIEARTRALRGSLSSACAAGAAIWQAKRRRVAGSAFKDAHTLQQGVTARLLTLDAFTDECSARVYHQKRTK